jgi:arginine decarboxylase
MLITVTAGTGEGPTPLAAFDAALLNAGVANYNLICLSSIIPAGGEVRRSKYVASSEEFGHRLYVVLARHDEHHPGKSAWAGLGWSQESDKGCGLFVELHGSSSSEVEDAITVTLESMMAKRGKTFGPIHRELAGIDCRGSPVCALVVAVYRSESWNW